MKTFWGYIQLRLPPPPRNRVRQNVKQSLVAILNSSSLVWLCMPLCLSNGRDRHTRARSLILPRTNALRVRLFPCCSALGQRTFSIFVVFESMAFSGRGAGSTGINTFIFLQGFQVLEPHRPELLYYMVLQAIFMSSAWRQRLGKFTY